MLSPADLAQTLKRSSPSETQTAIEAVELEALWGLQASVTTKPDLAKQVQPQIEALAKTGAPNVRVEAQNLLKKLP
jgi:DNA-binding TFAR19-related protein (PDSD5 family)